MTAKSTIYLGADHRGFRLKNRLVGFLLQRGYRAIDLGTHSPGVVDYPDIARDVASRVEKGQGLGILICSTGIGMDIAANKFRRVRAGTVWDASVAARSRREDDVNVLCLPSDFLTRKSAEHITLRWLRTRFSPIARYQRRKRKLNRLER